MHNYYCTKCDINLSTCMHVAIYVYELIELAGGTLPI